MRNVSTGVAILMVLGSGARAGARSHSESDLQLTVRVYDLARVGADDIHQAEQRADSIFRQAKISVTWILGSASQRGS